MSLLELALNSLSPYQREIFEELKEKGSGGMALKMGVGKTRLSMALGIYNGGRFLVVCTIDQAREWKHEKRKVFGKKLKYEIVSSKLMDVDNWQMKPDTRMVIVTREILAKRYKAFDRGFLHVVGQDTNLHGQNINTYQTAQHPIFLADEEETGIKTLYMTQWTSLFIDEGPDYYNIKRARCISLCALSATKRWVLSGTILTNPRVHRVLGFYCLIDNKEVPRNVYDLARFMASPDYPGLEACCVVRTENPAVAHIEIITRIVSHSMFPNEQKVYITFKETVRRINEQIEYLKDTGATGEEIKLFTSYLLAVIIYLRQSILCPLLPIANIALQMADYESKNELSNIVNAEIGRLHIDDWLNDEDSVYSSRLRAIVSTLATIRETMGDQRVIMFCSHRTSVNLLSYFIMDREVLVVTPQMNPKRREQELIDFENTKDGVLLYTYQLGSKGLNLQTGSHIVFIVDFEWSDADTNQAINRVVRPGQESDKVYAYYFTSNTGVESVVLRTQLKKRKVVNEMMKGPVKRFLRSSKLAEFVNNMIKVEDNIKVVEKLYINTEEIDMPAEGNEDDDLPDAEAWYEQDEDLLYE